MTTLTKDILIEKIKDLTAMSVKEAKEIVEIILESLKGELEEGHEVKISGFGKWNVRSKEARKGRNPHTGDLIEISPRRVVTFHPSDKLREAVNAASLADIHSVHNKTKAVSQPAATEKKRRNG